MKKLLLAATVFAIATPAVAAPGDSESYKLALSGSVASNCELIPEGSGTFNVDMLNTGNQGALAIVYSCNSPYTVSLKSKYGGMRHAESSGAVNIDYDIEAQGFFGLNQTTTNSANMTTPVVIVTNTDWQNIITNGGVRTGNLDLSFDSLSEQAVAGTYEDELTITLAAQL